MTSDGIGKSCTYLRSLLVIIDEQSATAHEYGMRNMDDSVPP